jgi:hypothetical protein
MSGNNVLMRISRPERGEGMGGQRKLCDELQNIYSSPDSKLLK